MSSAGTYLFYFFAALVLASSIAAVTSRRILRAAVYLLFALAGTAAFYFMVDYFFLAAVQLLVYAGGIVVLIIFSILLTSDIHEKMEKPAPLKVVASLALVLTSFGLIAFVISNFDFMPSGDAPTKLSMREVGKTLLSYSEGGYVLPFEVISIVLLAALAGAIVIAKRNPPAT
ncbi:MAG: NADH-quinone oxidoreductase subunit J [Cyclobacteriaceae bacterium]|nr:NADH-quinone oxidoreductase subunit J [Cyclobacteriaceae bacterium]MCX7638396.1 NADH-quinone oxidoreductase subunit J [Cyclobacteriaceae bacterium]MDW8330204.1 NADH-quinone oxidoreductase subunit J [Cyclobacteriaceae bacterium]